MASNVCKFCHGQGGVFDGGFWYTCDFCHTVAGKFAGLPKTHPLAPPVKEAVKHPTHYGKHPSGIECIDVVQHMGFNLGNAVKYIWRADLKNDAIEDMKKAIQYLEFEIAKRTKK